MANIRKTFNFRNGVQVDEDNFIVDALGKVGVGTTVPTQFIDCRGDAKIVGILTSQSFETTNVNISGVTTFSGETHVGTGITFYPASGIISATSIRADGRNLINIPTSQWTDINSGLGHTSIYNSGFVGVSTNDPRFTFQVGGNNDLTTFTNGVGINSTGNIVVTGVVTATNFKGDLQGSSVDSTMVDAGGLTVSGISTISGINVSSAHISNVLSVGSTNLNVSGVSTFIGQVKFDNSDAGKDVEWQPTNDRLSFMDDVKATFGSGADFSITHDGSDAYLQNTGSGLLYLDATSTIVRNKAGSQDIAKFTEGNSGCALYCSNGVKLTTIQEGIRVTGIASAAQFTGAVNAGVATISSTLDLGSVSSLGISTSTPQSEFHVYNAGISSVLIESGSNESVVALGRNLNLQTSSSVRYGNKNAGFPYSNENALDFINYDTGNVNFYLSAGATAGTGDFVWHYRQNTARLMTLTNDGKLGIGITLPTNNVHVVGTTTCTSDAFVGNDLFVVGDMTAGGAVITGGGIKANIVADNGDIIVSKGPNKAGAMVNASLNSATGVSTVSTLEVNGTVGVRTDDLINNLVLVQGPNDAEINGDFRFSVTDKGHIGVGIASALCTADFAGIGNTYRHYMRPPQLTNANRAIMEAEAESGALEGAMIYNSNTKKLQFYNGSAWETVTSST